MLAAMVVGGLARVALAGEAAPPPIVNGDTTSDYPQVVTLASFASNGQGYNFCSGTLIASRWVLTAAHCAEAFTSNKRAGYTEHYAIVGNNISTDNGIEAYAGVADWEEHPDYDSQRLTDDVGIVELDDDLPYDPMPVNKDALRKADVGDDYRYVGWGITKDNRTDSTKKRFADIPLNQYDSGTLIGYDEEQNVCSGDSGGAALEFVEGGFELAGVNSYVFSPDGDSTPCAGGASGAMRVDAQIEWIEQFTPVQSFEEMHGGGDADTDADSDADADADADGDADGDADREVESSDDDDDDDEVSYTWTCASGGDLEAQWLAVAAAVAIAARRRSSRAT